MVLTDSLRDVIEDPDFTDPVTVRHDLSSDADGDGTVEFSLSAPESMELLICSPEHTPFEITRTGQNDDTEFAAVAMVDAGIRDDDRITYDPGFGQKHYRAVELKPTSFDGDQFAWYRLVEDNRGETTADDETGGDPGVR